MQHRNARPTPTGRLYMVRLVEEQGLTFEAAAAASNVSKSTVHTWVWRWRAASPKERSSLACLEGRSSRPRAEPEGSSRRATTIASARCAGALAGVRG
jgi:Homeodomain-like domain-containing protein